jgi:hypothetical protein
LFAMTISWRITLAWALAPEMRNFDGDQKMLKVVENVEKVSTRLNAGPCVQLSKFPKVLLLHIAQVALLGDDVGRAPAIMAKQSKMVPKFMRKGFFLDHTFNSSGAHRIIARWGCCWAMLWSTRSFLRKAVEQVLSGQKVDLNWLKLSFEPGSGKQCPSPYDCQVMLLRDDVVDEVLLQERGADERALPVVLQHAPVVGQHRVRTALDRGKVARAADLVQQEVL